MPNTCLRMQRQPGDDSDDVDSAVDSLVDSIDLGISLRSLHSTSSITCLVRCTRRVHSACKMPGDSIVDVLLMYMQIFSQKKIVHALTENILYRKMISYVLFILVIHDPERILDRMHQSVQESLQMFTSYANSQVLIQDHQELIHIQRQLEHISYKLETISRDASH